VPKEPDWDKLGEIAAEAKSLRLSKELTLERFEGLLDAAEKACNGNSRFIESVLLWAPEGYVD
jgi:hypothetical protein